ncbi:MAG TPA: permease [Candidatus Polarisedimenticolaceae bacterium]|nr:permease [Candidatus Polarisedimenticolaceae bacterium]
MDTSTIVMLAAAILALIAIYWKSPQSASDGLTATGALIIEIIPRMVAAFTLAGLIQAVVPQEVIVRWMGHGSGAKGIFIGMTLGSITPGGPMTHFPVVASLYKVGIGVGPLVAYLTAWSLFGLQRVIMWEIPFLGPKIVAVRFAVSFFFPVLAGWLCELIWNKLQLQV